MFQNPRHSDYYKLQLFANSIPSSVAMEEWNFFVEAMALPLSVTFRISDRCNSLMQVVLHNRLATQFRFIIWSHKYLVSQIKMIFLIRYHLESSKVACYWTLMVMLLLLMWSKKLIGSRRPTRLSWTQLFQPETNRTVLVNVVRQELVSMIPTLLLDVKASRSIRIPYISPRLVIHY